MHYMVYVLCNPARTLFYIGVTGGFTDALLSDALFPPGVSLWNQCTKLVHLRRFRELEFAAGYIDRLQDGVNRWDFSMIEKNNRSWDDLSAQWLNPSKLLSFRVIKSTMLCWDN